jgi:capsular polysaccharide biosynthesis protein
VAKNPPKYVSDFLAIVEREVIYLDGPVQINSLTLVQKNQDSGWPHPKDLDILRRFGPFFSIIEPALPTRKIYTSRRGSKRSPGNESQIEELFRDHGFEIFQMEHLDLLDEVRLMSETSVIAGVHGSSLANIIWMPSGGAMLDLANDNYWTEAGHRLAHLRESDYHSVIYKGEFYSSIDCHEIEKVIVTMSRN